MKNGGRIMIRTKERMNCISAETIKRLGLGEDWQKTISTKQQKMVERLATKYKGALRKLSKN